MSNHSSKLRTLFTVTLLDNISLTVGTPVLTFLCFDISSSLFPAATSHATRSFWYGICSALPYTIAIFTGTLLSLMSDRYGRKKILLIGACGAFFLTLFSAIGIITGSLTILLAGCFIAGLCSQTRPVALAMTADLSEPPHLTLNMSYLQLGVSLGAFLGPLIGGYFARRFFFSTLNFSAPYFIGSAIALVTIFITQLNLQEKPRLTAPPHNTLKSTLMILRNKHVLQISLLLIPIQIAWRIYYQFISPVLQVSMHQSTTTIGVFTAMIAIWLCLGCSIGVKILKQYFSDTQMIFYTNCAMLVGMLLTIIGCELNSSLWSKIFIWGAAIPIAMGDVITFSVITALYAKTVESHNQGKVMALCYIVVTTITAATNFCGGLLAAINIKLPIFLAPIGILIVFVYAKRLLRSVSEL